MANRYEHRVAFNVDLFMTIDTDSPDTPLDQLEMRAIMAFRDCAVDGDDPVLADVGINVRDLNSVQGRIYPRHVPRIPPQRGEDGIWDNGTSCPTNDAEVCLDNFSVEDVSEVKNAAHS